MNPERGQKLTIAPIEPKGASFEVMFNPNTYSVTKMVSWEAGDVNRKLNAPPLTFNGGQARTLALDLFFDVTELPVSRRDVRIETNRIVKLTQILRDITEPRPPVCQLSWGMSRPGSDFPFIGVITSLTQNFTLFAADGTPLRANLSVGFTEFLTPERDLRQTDPEFTTRTVRRGDSLSSIAAEVYRNPKSWRIIAEANAIDDPRQLPPGTRLNLPKSV